MQIIWNNYHDSPPTSNWNYDVIIKYTDGRIIKVSAGWLRTYYSIEDYWDILWTEYSDDVWNKLTEQIN